MAKGKQEKQGLFDPERLKWFRNVNFAGAVALAGAGIAFPAFQEGLFLTAGLNTAQAGGAEIVRQRKTKQKISATV